VVAKARGGVACCESDYARALAPPRARDESTAEYLAWNIFCSMIFVFTGVDVD